MSMKKTVSILGHDNAWWWRCTNFFSSGKQDTGGACMGTSTYITVTLLDRTSLGSAFVCVQPPNLGHLYARAQERLQPVPLP